MARRTTKSKPIIQRLAFIEEAIVGVTVMWLAIYRHTTRAVQESLRERLEELRTHLRDGKWVSESELHNVFERAMELQREVASRTAEANLDGLELPQGLSAREDQSFLHYFWHKRWADGRCLIVSLHFLREPVVTAGDGKSAKVPLPHGIRWAIIIRGTENEVHQAIARCPNTFRWIEDPEMVNEIHWT